MKQKRQKNIENDKVRKYSVLYLNIVIRTIISLTIIVMVLSIFSYFLDIKNPYLKFGLFILIAMGISPFIPDINLGEKFYDSYMNFLEGSFKNGRK